ncbi:hypothetical protein [Sphingobacterium siyangense]|uniref:hypothetical protein n=1 Tax=Sphingobacterium siyangense TaxID=459529 RepID=UPI003DA66B8D
MKIEKHYINKNEYFSKIFPLIPSDTLINKNITGIGATTAEIEAMRHSIIIEPYKPVIDGKTNKYPNTLAVNSSANLSDILKYLQNDKIKNKKFLSTPESLYKIIIACKALKIDVYNDYFLLFDECEKTITDIHYRGRIIKPMDEFFKFKNKALISATALIFSDPRFKQNGFKLINITPRYDNRKKVSILNTNNTIYSLIDELKKTTNNGKKKFVFLNSIKAITSVIKMMDIRDESAILCSETSIRKIRKEQYGHVSEIIEETKFKEFNFLTERFNSGVDINLEEDIEIYIVSDANISQGTLVNPNTDVFQIIGRFRDTEIERTRTTIVIASTDSEIVYMKKSSVTIFLKVLQQCYQVIMLALDTLSDKTNRIILKELSQLLSFNTFINDNGTKNYFMIDNLYYKNLVKSYYCHDKRLNSIYKNATLLGTKINRYKIGKIYHKIHNINSGDLQLFGDTKSYREILTEIVIELLQFEEDTASYLLSGIDSIKNQYKIVFPEIIEAYDKFGGEELLTNCCSKQDVISLLSRDAHIVALQNFSFLTEFKTTFYEDRFDDKPALIEDFQYLIDKYNIENINKTTDLVDLERFVEIGSRTRRAQRRGYRVGKCKY